MKGNRLQDAFFRRDQMKAMGLPPDVNLYNFLISTCGKCKNPDGAIKLLEEMKRHGVKLKGETYICLLNACAATGRTDQVYAIVRDMTAAGLGLNNFGYAGLITAFKNKLPITEETTTKLREEGWLYSSMDATCTRYPGKKMNARGFFLNPKMGSDLLLAAAAEKMGGHTTANYIWDLLQSCKINPSLPVVEAYLEGLKQREIPADDPRLLMVSRMLNNLRLRFGGRRNA